MPSKLTVILDQGARDAEDRAEAHVEKQLGERDKEAVGAEIERLDFKPDDIPMHVWDLIQENGEIATEKLNQILLSPRFMRIRPGDQAKLIALAQNRAYGTPKQNKVDPRRSTGLIDVTAKELQDLANRTMLPEYKLSQSKTVDYDTQPEDDEL